MAVTGTVRRPLVSPVGGAALVWMISIALTSGFSWTWEKSMFTVPSLFSSNAFMVPRWSPVVATMSKWSRTVVPSRLTLKTRSPGLLVPL